jgi:NADH:ubiquinone oxidoreductase subunit 2 (subunit N)
LWQAAGQLLWLTPSVLGGGDATWLSVGWSHDLLVLAAMSAIAVSWAGRSSPVAYLDELRGLGTIRPASAALLLIPLFSLFGGPLVAGSWLRLTMMSQLFAVHVPGPDDLQLPRLDVRDALLVWSVIGVAAARAAVEIVRVVLLETPLRIDAKPRGRWATGIAALPAIVLIVAGCWPQLLTLMAR